MTAAPAISQVPAVIFDHDETLLQRDMKTEMREPGVRTVAAGALIDRNEARL